MEHLEYEATVNALHGLVGTTVSVFIGDKPTDAASLDVACTLQGVLKSATEADAELATLMAEPGEALIFRIGESNESFGTFTIRESTFGGAQWREVRGVRTLLITIRRVIVMVAPQGRLTATG